MDREPSWGDPPLNPHRTHMDIHETEWGTYELSVISGGLSTYLGTYATRAAAVLAYAGRNIR